MKTQRHKGHREDGISPRNSVLSVSLCFKKISSDILERMGSTLMLSVEDMVRTVGRIVWLPNQFPNKRERINYNIDFTPTRITFDLTLTNYHA